MQPALVEAAVADYYQYVELGEDVVQTSSRPRSPLGAAGDGQHRRAARRAINNVPS
jgi:hypothetical protein